MTLPLLNLLPRPPVRRALGQFPTPLEEAPVVARALGLESLLIKREDRSGSQFGGNKLRALEWLLPTAAPGIVTMGGYGSSWCAALTAAARGHRVHAALFPQPWSAVVAGTLATTAAAATVYLSSRRAGLPVALWRAWLGARREGSVSWFPAGGATPLAVLGTVNAALELSTQLPATQPRPGAVVVPLGSGGTAAGLLIGMWLAAWPVDIVAVRVTDPWFASRRRVLSLVRRTAALLARCGCRVPGGVARLRIIPDELGGGYGYPTERGQQARDRFAEAGLTLDVTYGGKAAAALAGLAGSFRHVCFWHTFDARLAASDPKSMPLVQQAHACAEALWPSLKSI